MSFKSVWWYPNYVEYGAGLQPGKTWPNVMEQYRRPHALYDLRQYDIPTEPYEAKLYYRFPRMGQPEYRGTFRDKPHTLPSYYPEEWPAGKPKGFHGRVYYEDGPPEFKYQGPKLDKLYWLERPPYVPKPPESKVVALNSTRETGRGLNESLPSREFTTQTRFPLTKSGTGVMSQSQTSDYSRSMKGSGSTAGRQTNISNSIKRTTQDGVGFL